MAKREQPKKKRKANKEQREKQRAERADLFNDAFTYGYSMGYNQAITDMERGKIVCREGKFISMSYADADASSQLENGVIDRTESNQNTSKAIILK